MLLKVVGGFVLLVAFIAVLGLLFTVPAMLIWNAYAVPTFGAPVLGFWQTFWLLVLARIICSPSSCKVS